MLYKCFLQFCPSECPLPSLFPYAPSSPNIACLSPKNFQQAITVLSKHKGEQIFESKTR